MPSPPPLPERGYEEMTAEEILGTLLDGFPGRVALACSFQKEASVLVDMLFRIDARARVFTLDTHLLFPETYAVWRAIERRYRTTVEVYGASSLGRQAAIHGEALWESDPALCCALRKLEPLGRALAGLDCWITGMRRDQSPSRAATAKVGWDARHGLWKANPLADWDDARCWEYLSEHGIPYNELHDRGYASIGCTHCTRPGEGREGRWAGLDKTECGLHPREAGRPLAGVASS